MVKGNKVPFVNENLKMNKALKILTQKKLGAFLLCEIIKIKQRA
jgi:arabinose-5-phosphate isomerase